MRPPSEPRYSCPNLDSAIAEIENAITIHDELRNWGKYWEEKAAEIEKDLTEHYESELKWKEEVCCQLQDEIFELKQEIEQLNMIIQSLQD